MLSGDELYGDEITSGPDEWAELFELRPTPWDQRLPGFDEDDDAEGAEVVELRPGPYDRPLPLDRRNMGTTGGPTNAAIGNRYSGGNALNFAVVAMQHGYPSRRWATYKQWEQVGAQVDAAVSAAPAASTGTSARAAPAASTGTSARATPAATSIPTVARR